MKLYYKLATRLSVQQLRWLQDCNKVENITNPKLLPPCYKIITTLNAHGDYHMFEHTWWHWAIRKYSQELRTTWLIILIIPFCLTVTSTGSLLAVVCGLKTSATQLTTEPLFSVLPSTERFLTRIFKLILTLTVALLSKPLAISSESIDWLFTNQLMISATAVQDKTDVLFCITFVDLGDTTIASKQNLMWHVSK